MKKPKKLLVNKLLEMDACIDSINWIEGLEKKYGRTLTAQEIWDKCTNPEWMCWYIAQLGVTSIKATQILCVFTREFRKLSNLEDEALGALEQFLMDHSVISESLYDALVWIQENDPLKHGYFLEAYAFVDSDWTLGTVRKGSKWYFYYYLTSTVNAKTVKSHKLCDRIRSIFPDVPQGTL